MKFDRLKPATWIPRDLFALYCGADSAKMLSYYAKAVVKGNSRAWDFNLLAFLFLPAWFGYRRLWAPYTAMVVLAGAFLFAEIVLDFTTPSGAFMGTYVCFGFLANGWLLSKASQLHSSYQQQGLEDAEIALLLTDKAKGSVALAIAASIAYLAILYGLVSLAFFFVE